MEHLSKQGKLLMSSLTMQCTSCTSDSTGSSTYTQAEQIVRAVLSVTNIMLQHLTNNILQHLTNKEAA